MLVNNCNSLAVDICSMCRRVLCCFASCTAEKELSKQASTSRISGWKDAWSALGYFSLFAFTTRVHLRSVWQSAIRFQKRVCSASGNYLPAYCPCWNP